MTKLPSKIEVHPLLIAFVFISLLSGYFKYILYIFLIVSIHELGHIVTSSIFDRRIEKVSLLPFGGLLKFDYFISSNIFEDLLIASSGVFAQTILGFIFIGLLYFGLMSHSTYLFLSSYNRAIIMFNLLPICPLDGYKILKNFMELVFPYKKTFAISSLLSAFAIIAIVLLNRELVLDNPFVFAFCIFEVIKEAKNLKYHMFRFYLERTLHHFSYPPLAIDDISQMYKNKNHTISGYQESIYLKAHLHKNNY